jgi:hypothetical protein
MIPTGENMTLLKHIVYSTLFIIFLINNTGAITNQVYISNDGYVYQQYPTSNYNNFPAGVGKIGEYSGYPGKDYESFLELPIISVGYTYLHLYCNSNCAGTVNVYNTNYFSQTNITWNTKPITGSLITSFTLVAGANIININTITGRYIRLTSASTSEISIAFNGSANPPYVDEIIIQTNIIIGSTYFKDVNNSISILPYTKIELNNLTNTTSDINGNYNFSNVINGTYILQAIKNNAYSIEYNTTTFNSGIGALINFTLNFSKPFIATPYLEGNYIKGVYSNNLRSINLWENPSYVFGIYILSNKTYFKQCSVETNIRFVCDNIPNQNYTFHFLYSDIYNDNLTKYHPTLTGSRNFTSEDLTISPEIAASSNQLSKNPDREKVVKNNVYTSLVILLFIIALIVVASLFEFERVDEVYKRR